VRRTISDGSATTVGRHAGPGSGSMGSPCSSAIPGIIFVPRSWMRPRGAQMPRYIATRLYNAKAERGEACSR